MAFKSYLEPFIIKSRNLVPEEVRNLMEITWLIRGRAKTTGYIIKACGSFYAQPAVSHLLAPAAEAPLNTFSVESIVLNTKSSTTGSTNKETRPLMMAKQGHCCLSLRSKIRCQVADMHQSGCNGRNPRRPPPQDLMQNRSSYME